MIKKYSIFSVVAIFTSLLIVLSTTAVPYTHSTIVKQETDIVDEIQKIIVNKKFGNLRSIAEKIIDEETRYEIRNSMKGILIEAGLQQNRDEYELLVEFLVVIAEILLILFGYNPLGQSITAAIVGLIALLPMLIIALPYTPIVIFAITIDLITENKDMVDDIIINFGLLGLVILFITLLPVYLVMAALSFLPIYILIVLNETLNITYEVFSRIQV